MTFFLIWKNIVPTSFLFLIFLLFFFCGSSLKKIKANILLLLTFLGNFLIDSIIVLVKQGEINKLYENELRSENVFSFSLPFFFFKGYILLEQIQSRLSLTS